MSGVPGNALTFSLYRKPAVKRPFRTATSGFVSLLRMCDMHRCRCCLVNLSAMIVCSR